MSPGGDLLESVMAETLEHFAFLFSETEEDLTILARANSYLEAHISYQGGGVQGMLTIAAPTSLCEEMAANILGLDPGEIPQEAPVDAIKELSNVLAGSLSARSIGTQIPCALQTPTARVITTEQAIKLASETGARVFNVEENGVVAAFKEQTLEA